MRPYFSLEKKNENKNKQAGAELGQAQHKLGFDSTLIFYKFGFYRSACRDDHFLQT